MNTMHKITIQEKRVIHFLINKRHNGENNITAQKLGLKYKINMICNKFYNKF